MALPIALTGVAQSGDGIVSAIHRQTPDQLAIATEVGAGPTSEFGLGAGKREYADRIGPHLRYRALEELGRLEAAGRGRPLVADCGCSKNDGWTIRRSRV
jgi:hypothetical protein